MCKGRAEPLDPKEDRHKLYPEIAPRNAMQQDFDPEYGRVIYTLSEREKIKKSHHSRLARTLYWSLMIKRERMAG